MFPYVKYEFMLMKINKIIKKRVNINNQFHVNIIFYEILVL